MAAQQIPDVFVWVCVATFSLLCNNYFIAINHLQEKTMEKFAVKLANAASPTGVAFIGPCKVDGFRVDKLEEAFKFNLKVEADIFAEHMVGRFRGFHGGAEISVVPA